MFFILIFKLRFFMYIIMYDNNKPSIFIPTEFECKFHVKIKRTLFRCQ